MCRSVKTFYCKSMLQQHRLRLKLGLIIAKNCKSSLLQLKAQIEIKFVAENHLYCLPLEIKQEEQRIQCNK